MKVKNTKLACLVFLVMWWQMETLVDRDEQEEEEAVVVIGGNSVGSKSKSNTSNSSSSQNPNSQDYDDVSLKLGSVLFLHIHYNPKDLPANLKNA